MGIFIIFFFFSCHPISIIFPYLASESKEDLKGKSVGLFSLFSFIKHFILYYSFLAWQYQKLAMVRIRDAIDSHKLLTLPLIFYFIYYFNQWDNMIAWIYVSIHGTYGYMWVLKSTYFPDKRWEKEIPLTEFLGIFGTVGLFWIAPFLICYNSVQLPPYLVGIALMIYTFGVFLHFVGDMQKHCHLKLKPGHLVTDGVWTRTRNPNYLGEMLIYIGFAILANHWIPWIINALFMFGMWVPNMNLKDKSLERYPEFAKWKAQSNQFFPTIPVVTPLAIKSD